jgi:hypothetical protein
MRVRARRTIALLSAWLLSPVVLAAPSAEERGLTQLRDTVANLLQALVDKGVLTREQAQAMVRDAETKAEAEMTARADQEKAQEEQEKNAVRVPYVPQVVKEEISKEVVAELGPSVKKEVVEEVSSKGSLFAALPEWMQRMTWLGDVRMRDEGDVFGNGNATNTYLDFNQVNSKGGIAKAGPSGLLNTTEDRNRLRLRLRFGFDVDLGSGWMASMRLATGSGEIYPTTNQSLGTYGAKYQVAVDQGFLRWTGTSSTQRQILALTAGRFGNPYLATDMVWYPDLTFEGLTGNYRFNLSSSGASRHDLFATLGAFPLSNFSPLDPNPSGETKWLAAAQLGADIHTQDESRFAFGAAYYDYMRIVGQRNDPGSTLLNWTAPALFQKGNTLYDISNSTDPTVNLFALAADYKVVDLLALANFRVFSRYTAGFTAEALKNIGFDAAAVQARTGVYVAPRTRGYRADLTFGSSSFTVFGSWLASVGYRYLERDAVLDAFNDQDFHLGGTDAKGYTVRFDYAFTPRVWMRVKYMSANAIDGPPLAIDVWQVDVNTQF